jgi:leucyl-tRNA synthetase
MKMLNALEGFKGQAPLVVCEGFGLLLRALYPACPHTTWRLWQDLGYAAELADLLDAPWPQVDDAALVQDQIELVLQVNGKRRGVITVNADADDAAITAVTLSNPDYLRFAGAGKPKLVKIVPGRLVNIVV